MNIPFRITISKIEFDKLRNDKKFILILKLARIRNSMLSSWSLIDNPMNNEDTPASRRDLSTSFVYMCALLYETFHSVNNKKCIYDELYEEFSLYNSFKDLKVLKEDIDGIEYYNTLGKIRDKIVFHFDTDVIAESLKTYEIIADEVTLFESHSPNIRDVDSPLADHIVFHYLEKTSQLTFEEFVNKVAAFSKKFINSSEILLAELFTNLK